MLFRLMVESETKQSATTTDALVFPTIATLLLTGAMASMVCRTPDEPFRTWFGLLGYAGRFLLLAAGVHVVAVWGVSRIFSSQLQAPVKVVLRGTWLGVGLLLPFMLLATQGSAWAAAVPPVIAVTAVMFVRRGVPTAGRSANAPAPAGISSNLFALEEPCLLLRTLLPMVVVAIALEGAMALLLSWQYALSGLLLGLCAMVVMWAAPLHVRDPKGRATGWLARDTAIILLLTAVALVPSLGGSRLAGMVSAMLQPTRGAKRGHPPPPFHASGSAQNGALTGVILTLPPKPRQKSVRPPPSSQTPGKFSKSQPLIIPFDGAYWYFRSPERRPRADARMVRGDPMKVAIHSTDFRALQMEAHQRLSTPLRTDCCSTMRVVVHRADDQPGLIALELSLGDWSGGRGNEQTLGIQVLPSTKDPPHGPSKGPTDEVLLFDFPGRMRIEQFNEITIKVRPDRARARVGAHVAVERFELVP